MEVCRSNGELYQKLGNMSASAQYTNMADQCQRDLLAIKGIRSQVGGVEKWTSLHVCVCVCYRDLSKRLFNIVQ